MNKDKKKRYKENQKLLVSSTPIRAKRNRSEWEGMPEGTQASAHNWPDCK